MPADSSDADPNSSPGAGPWFLALLIWITGSAIIGVAAGWIPVDPGTVHGPPWLLAVAGLAIITAGFAPLAGAPRPRYWASQIAGLGTLAALAVIANWVAFGPGPRQFSGGFALGGLAMSHGSVSAVGGRILFGMGALLMDAFVLMAVLRWLRGTKGREQ